MLTATTGAIHPMLRAAGVPKEAIKWMMRVHSGNFYIVNLMPIYPFLVGFSTLTLAFTGLLMYLRASRRPAEAVTVVAGSAQAGGSPAPWQR